MPERRAWLGLGSNLGDRAALVEEAIRHLDAVPGLRVASRSNLYRTEPWGDADQGEFLNAAAEVRTTLAPPALLRACLAVEDALGRVRTRRWGPRAIDVDILHVEGVARAGPDLALPHPLWRERAFVLVPLHEIAPDLAIEGLPVREALAAVGREGVRRIAPAGETA